MKGLVSALVYLVGVGAVWVVWQLTGGRRRAERKRVRGEVLHIARSNPHEALLYLESHKNLFKPEDYETLRYAILEKIIHAS